MRSIISRLMFLGLASASPIFCANVACTGSIAVDTAAIQGSLNAGGTTTITAGPCAVSTVNATASGTNIQGGNFTWNEATNGNIIINVLADNVTINQVDFNGGVVEFPATNPVSQGRSNIIFTNNKVRNVTGGSTAAGAGALETNGLRNSTFTGNTFDNDFNGGYRNLAPPASNPYNSLQPACWSEFQGLDGTKIQNNTFTRCGNDGLHLQPNGAINYAPNPSDISYNTCHDTHRACYEIQSFLNNLTMKGNSAYAYNGPFFDSFAYSMASGGVNFVFANNLGSMNVGGCNTFGAAYFLELILRPTVVTGNVAQTISQAALGCPTWPFVADNWGDNSTNPSNTVNINNNVMCGDPAIVTFTHETPNAGQPNPLWMNYKCGSSNGCTSDTTNYKNTSSCPTALATSSVGAPVFISPPTSFPSGGSGTWNISEVSALPIKGVQFFVDSNPTPVVTQEFQDLNSSTFPTDRKWLYHVTYDTSSLSNGSHTMKAIATDVFGATNTTSSSFTRGTGTSPAVSLSATSLTYAARIVGTTSAAQAITLTNSGNATLNIASITLSGPTSADYAISANTCGATLAAAATCSVSITFTPSANGARVASLVLTNDAADSPQSVALTGTGTGGTSPCPNSLMPNNCDFESNIADPWQLFGGTYATLQVDMTGLGGLPAMHVTGLTIVPPGNNVEFFQDGLSYGPPGISYTVSITMSCSRTQQPNILAILSTTPFTSYATWSGGAGNWKPTCTAGTNTYTNTFVTANNPIPNRGRFTLQWDDIQLGDQIYVTNIVVKATASVGLSNINILGAPDHASATVQLTCSTNCYPYIYYGTTSGGPYQYTSLSYPMAQNMFTGQFSTAMTLGGLTPGTTYYILPTARPNANNDTGICNFPACGSVEQMVTTLPDPAVHPVPPTKPTLYVPTDPVTTGYTTIPMTVSGTTGECVAASNVTAPGGGGWVGNVTAGDNFQTLLAEIGYAAIIDIPQGVTCAQVQQSVYNHIGYSLVPLALDPAAGGNINSPNHRWIIIQTHQVTSAEFPAFGTQMTPEWSPKLAKLVVQNPAMPTNGQAPGLGVANLVGQLFDGSGAVHHLWFRNLEMTHLTNSTIYPGDQTDPPAFSDYIRLVPDISGNTPSYIVIERNYMHGQPWPAREIGLLWLVGSKIAIDNNYEDANVWWPGSYPTVDPTYSGATVNIPQSTFRLNAFGANPIGPTGTIGMTGTASVTFSGPNLSTYTGNFMGWLDSGGLTIAYQSASGVTATCTGCTATAFTKPTQGQTYALAALSRASNVVSFTTGGPPATNDAGAGITTTITGATDASFNGTCTNLVILTGSTFTCTQVGANATTTGGFVWIPPSFPPTVMWYFSGSFNGTGTAVPGNSVPQNVIPGFMRPFSPLGLYHNIVGADISGNYWHSIGQPIYSDPYALTSDYQISRNYFDFPRTQIKNSGVWDGYKYTNRNDIEEKICRRCWLWGNIFNGSNAYQNAGNAIFFFSIGGGPIDSQAGTSDILIENNILRHISAGIQCAGGGTVPPDYGLPRMQITGNIIFDLNRDLYNDGGGGFLSGPFAAYPNCEDLKIEHNTVAMTKGQGPAFHVFGGTGTGFTSVLAEGLSWRKNLVVMSLTNQNIVNVLFTMCGQFLASHPANPADACANVSTYTQMLNGSYIRAGVSSVVPNWLFDSNVFIGGVNTGAAPTYTDLTASQVSTIASTFPVPNTFTAGATLAARYNHVAWYDPSDADSASYCLQDASDYIAGNNPYGKQSSLGADCVKVLDRTGQISPIGITPDISGTSVLIEWSVTAGATCSVDIAPNFTDPNVISGTRTSSASVVPYHSATISGLTTKTFYAVRVSCPGNFTAQWRPKFWSN